jgi:hypothetical protein
MKRYIAAAVAAVAFSAATPTFAADFILLQKSSVSPSAGANAFYDNFHITSVGGVSTSASLLNVPTTASFTDNFYFALFQTAVGSGSAQSDFTSNIAFGIPGLTLTAYTMSGAVQSALFNAFTSSDYVASGDLATVVGAAIAGNQVGPVIPGTINGADRKLTSVPLLNTLFYKITINGTSPAPGDSQYTGQLTATSVPEPATWAMMLAGFGLIGFAMRRKRQSHPQVRFAF